MKRFAVAYIDESGMLDIVAGHVAEGLRFAGCAADVIRAADLACDDPSPVREYSGYVVGSTRFDEEVALTLRQVVGRRARGHDAAEERGQSGADAGVYGGAFGSYASCGRPAATLLHAMMEGTLGMDMLDLGPLTVMPWQLGTPQGTRAAQQFGRAIGERVGGAA